MMQVIADIRVQSGAEMNEKLDAAVSTAFSQLVQDETRGVLLTRHDHEHFSVSLTPEIPFGTIHEHDYIVGRIGS